MQSRFVHKKPPPAGSFSIYKAAKVETDTEPDDEPEMSAGMNLQKFEHLMNKEVEKMLALSTTDQAIARRSRSAPRIPSISSEHIEQVAGFGGSSSSNLVHRKKW